MERVDHHIAVATPRFEDAMAKQVEGGNTAVCSGTFGVKPASDAS